MYNIYNFNRFSLSKYLTLEFQKLGSSRPEVHSSLLWGLPHQVTSNDPPHSKSSAQKCSLNPHTPSHLQCDFELYKN